MRRFLQTSLLLSLMIFTRPALSPVLQDEVDPEVAAIFEDMTSEERVGQLFLVTFYGSEILPESDIVTLVQDYHVGGVVLLRENDNFSDLSELPAQVYQLTGDLQRLAAGFDPASDDRAEFDPDSDRPYVPLFIGLGNESQDWPSSALLSGLSPAPTSLAIGATWDPALSEAAGSVMGQELSALGFNLFMGPSADVVEQPQPSEGGDLGTQVFGGEAYWVSEMTAAYVKGLHDGSEGRVAVVPRHFPGYGGADRLASIEIPTVRRSLDQLVQVDLQPFFAVTGEAQNEASVADGLLVGHVSYQGFQGDNPRLTTRPISLDATPLGELMALAPIADWRADGGLMISDSLSLRGVRRFYDPQEIIFQGRRIAQDAFSAGNDMLYLGNFGVNPPTDQTASVVDTIDYFLFQYESDPVFQAQVDASVQRIIAKKLDLYGEFELDEVLPAPEGLENLGAQSDVTVEIAYSALTLLSPSSVERVLTPQPGEDILIFTDTRFVQQCSTCTLRPLISLDALRAAILRSYGPDATGLVSFANLLPFSFQDLSTYLEFGPVRPAEGAETPEPDQLELALTTAEWVVFVMLDEDATVPASDVVQRFLAEPPVSADTHIVVMAMDTPNFLDSTEIGKLSAYYALYGYSAPFFDVAARALFQGVTADGAPPVSVSAIDYDIMDATSPDPFQIIDLSFEVEGLGDEATPPAEVIVEQGDGLRLTTGVILDRNGNPVPDGTPVDFVINYANEAVRDTVSTTTLDGVAQGSVVLRLLGEVLISAKSGDALNSLVIRLTTGTSDIAVELPDIVPTSAPNSTQVQPTPLPTQEIPLTTTPEEPPAEASTGDRSVGFNDLFLSLLGLAGLGIGIFILGYGLRGLSQGILIALSSLVTGLLGYNYYAMLLPGALWWHDFLNTLGGVRTADWAASLIAWIASMLGGALCLVGILIWERWLVRSLRDRQER